MLKKISSAKEAGTYEEQKEGELILQRAKKELVVLVVQNFVVVLQQAVVRARKIGLEAAQLVDVRATALAKLRQDQQCCQKDRHWVQKGQQKGQGL